jgi:transcriptional regulator with XRE-family HTH domain
MNDQDIGRVVRAVRRNRGLRQSDVAELARVPQSVVSRLERGYLINLRLTNVRRVCEALEIALSFTVAWRGGQLARLMDQDHAAIVEWVVHELTRLGWESLVEYTFSVYGERGSVDVIGWHAATRTLLIVEVKSRVVDQQDLFSSLDRKARLVPGQLARDRGWNPLAIGQILVLLESTFNREVVAGHRASFDSRLPQRARAIRRWLADPAGNLGGVLFARRSRAATGMCRRGGPDRVRRPRSGQSGNCRVRGDA